MCHKNVVCFLFFKTFCANAIIKTDKAKSRI